MVASPGSRREWSDTWSGCSSADCGWPGSASSRCRRVSSPPSSCTSVSPAARSGSQGSGWPASWLTTPDRCGIISRGIISRLSQDLAWQVWDDYLKATPDICGITRNVLDYLKITSDIFEDYVGHVWDYLKTTLHMCGIIKITSDMYWINSRLPRHVWD